MSRRIASDPERNRDPFGQGLEGSECPEPCGSGWGFRNHKRGVWKSVWLRRNVTNGL